MPRYTLIIGIIGLLLSVMFGCPRGGPLFQRISDETDGDFDNPCALDDVCNPECEPQTDPDCANLGCSEDGICNPDCFGDDIDCSQETCSADDQCNPDCDAGEDPDCADMGCGEDDLCNPDCLQDDPDCV